MSGSSSDDAGPSEGEEGDHTSPSYITPQTVHAGVSSGQVAALWTVRSGGTAEEGEEKGPAAAIEDLPEVSAVPSTLTALQQRVLDRLVGSFDTTDCSIVVTNPHVKDNPIVYVTEPWQRMCGFTAREAIGRNPRLTQGQRSDSHAMRSISSALQRERACTVLMLNYRSGLQDQPFWNMLSINPVHHQGQLSLYMASLQDYSYQIGRIVSMTPSQFCRAAEHHQRQRRLGSTLQPQLLAKPTIYEADDDFSLLNPVQLASEPQLVKRLGWDRLRLEPEHLVDRVVDALQRMEAQVQLSETSTPNGDTYSIVARVNDVACRIVIDEDLMEGCYRVQCMRVSGDTFSYHAAFRQLREILTEDNFSSDRLLR